MSQEWHTSCIKKLFFLKQFHLMRVFSFFPFFPPADGSGTAVVEVKNVSGLLGRSARLPCDTTPPSPDNPLLLVIWFKEPSPDPVYRYIVLKDLYLSELQLFRENPLVKECYPSFHFWRLFLCIYLQCMASLPCTLAKIGDSFLM